MQKMLTKQINRHFDIAPVQYYEENKGLMTVQDVMGTGEHLAGALSGFILGQHENVPMVQEMEGHRTVIGATGSGKGVSVVIPDLLAHLGSAVSLEIGGATFRATYNHRKHNLKQNVIIIDPKNVIGYGSHSYNPLDDLDPGSRDFFTHTMSLAASLTADAYGREEPNPYFRENPQNLIAALIIYMKLADPKDVPLEDRNLIGLAKIFSQYPSETWRKYMEALKGWSGDHAILLNQMGNYLASSQDNDQNARSIVSATAQWFSKWAADDNALAKYLKKSDFSMKDLRNKKTTLYIVMPRVEDYIVYQPWLRILLQNAFDCTPNYGDGGRGFRHEDRILFMIDEMTQLGRLDVVTNGAQTLRQKGIVLCGIFQNYAKLKEVYGEEAASAYISASSVVQVLRNAESSTLDFVSKHLGGYMVYVPTISEGQSYQWNHQENKGEVKGTNEQITWQKAITKSDSTTYVKTDSKGRSIAIGWNRFRSQAVGTHSSITNQSSSTIGEKDSSSTSGLSDTNGNSVVDTVGSGESLQLAQQINQSIAVGNVHQGGETNSDGGAKGSMESENKGSADGETFVENYNFSYQPIVRDGHDYRQIKEFFAGNKQILFVDNNDGSYCLNASQARYFEIPFLKERADGPPIPEIPAFPDPPERFTVSVAPLAQLHPEDFNMDASRLTWDPPSLTPWLPPSKIAEWGDTVRLARDEYEGARYRLDRFDERPIMGFFRSAAMQLLSAGGVVASCYIGGRLAAAGAAFGAIMLGGAAYAFWQRHKLKRDNMQKWKAYGQARGTALKTILDELAPTLITHDQNARMMEETVRTQHHFAAKDRDMRNALSRTHDVFHERLEEHEGVRQIFQKAFKDLRARVVTGWSSGDWAHYVHKLHRYYQARTDWFDFNEERYLPEPALVTPPKLGPKPPRTLHSSTAPMPDKLVSVPPEPAAEQKLSIVPQRAATARQNMQGYIDKPLNGFNLPDGVATVGDAVERRSQISNSEKRRDRKDVMLIDAALESVKDPRLETFNGHVREYVSALHVDESYYAHVIRAQLREGQKNVRRTIDAIRRFNGHVENLNDVQANFHGFARRLNEARMRAHHRAHARAVSDMASFEKRFQAQSRMLTEKGPPVPPRPRLQLAQTGSCLAAPVV